VTSAWPDPFHRVARDRWGVGRRAFPGADACRPACLEVDPSSERPEAVGRPAGPHSDALAPPAHRVMTLVLSLSSFPSPAVPLRPPPAAPRLAGASRTRPEDLGLVMYRSDRLQPGDRAATVPAPGGSRPVAFSGRPGESWSAPGAWPPPGRPRPEAARPSQKVAGVASSRSPIAGIDVRDRRRERHGAHPAGAHPTGAHPMGGGGRRGRRVPGGGAALRRVEGQVEEEKGDEGDREDHRRSSDRDPPSRRRAPASRVVPRTAGGCRVPVGHRRALAFLLGLRSAGPRPPAESPAEGSGRPQVLGCHGDDPGVGGVAGPTGTPAAWRAATASWRSLRATVAWPPGRVRAVMRSVM